LPITDADTDIFALLKPQLKAIISLRWKTIQHKI